MQRLLTIDSTDGYLWADLGRCYIELNEPQKSHSAFQQALFYLSNPKDPSIWYSIGLLYEMVSSFEHAEEAYLSVITMQEYSGSKVKLPDEIAKCYYRLGMIYSTRNDCLSLSELCFRFILSDTEAISLIKTNSHSLTAPFSTIDVLTQLALVLEKENKLPESREISDYLLKLDPDDTDFGRLSGWLFCREYEAMLERQTEDPASLSADLHALAEKAMSLLDRVLELDPSNHQSWYILGRLKCLAKAYPRAYEIYQQALLRNGSVPHVWNSIGILYYRIGQYKDSLDAFIRSIHLSPKESIVWTNLGVLYEQCAGQIGDAIESYTKALEYNPSNTMVRQRWGFLKTKIGVNSPLSMTEMHPFSHLPTIIPGSSLSTPGSAVSVSGSIPMANAFPTSRKNTTAEASQHTVPPTIAHRKPSSHAIPGPPKEKTACTVAATTNQIDVLAAFALSSELLPALTPTNQQPSD